MANFGQPGDVPTVRIVFGSLSRGLLSVVHNSVSGNSQHQIMNVEFRGHSISGIQY